MTVDTYDPILGIILQGTGNNNNTWGLIYNNSGTTPLAQAIAGVSTHAVTGGTLDLSASPPPAGLRQDIGAIHIFTGTLTADQTFIVPNISKKWVIFNNTTGAFQFFIKTPSGTARQIPQGKQIICWLDGANVIYRLDQHEIGNFVHHGGTTAPPGALACNGASLLRAEYPDLFNVISTTWGSVDGTHFTLPKLNDTNRYLRAADGTTITVGQYQANVTGPHTHAGAAFSGTTSTESADHTHSGSGTTSGDSNDHVHGYTAPNPALIDIPGGSAGPSVPGTSASNTAGVNAFHSHTYSFNTSGRSAAHTHTYSGTTGAIPTNTGTGTGTETRPESAGVLICIKY